MNQTVKDFFNLVADDYNHDDNPRIDELLSLLNIQKGTRILDLATGKGIISERLYQLSQNDVIALDISEKMIEAAKSRIDNPHIHFTVGDFYQYEDEPFDLIICFDAFPHFLDVEAFVNKSFELLKDNGVLAIIHDCGRGELNKHHAHHAEGVSRQLKEPNKEVEPFLSKFNIIDLGEGDDFYKIILKKSK